MQRHVRFVSCAVGTAIALSSRVSAQSRIEIKISETNVSPENLTASRDGSVYFGSTTKGTIYRAAPGASTAEPWILASSAGLTNVFGVLADDRSNTLWVCQNATGGRGGAPVVGQTALRSFDLRSGAAKGTYRFPPGSGVCNDIAIANDGTAYVTESFGGRVHRLRPRAATLEVWFSDSQTLNGADGIAILDEGAVYVNDFFSGKLFRIPVNSDGTAGTIVPLQASMPSTRADGLRTMGPRTLVQAEGVGRVTELTVDGDRVQVRVLQEGLTGATGVTFVGDTLLALINRASAVVVPYHRR
jgi:sugar lactone lactonase YvrE